MKARMGDSDQDGTLQLGGAFKVTLGGTAALLLGAQSGPIASGAGSVQIQTRDRFRKVSATTSIGGAGGNGGGGGGGGGGGTGGGSYRPRSAY